MFRILNIYIIYKLNMNIMLIYLYIKMNYSIEFLIIFFKYYLRSKGLSTFIPDVNLNIAYTVLIIYF
jgi:hypothetical protein